MAANTVLKKMDRLTNWQAVLVIVVVGFVVLSTGLTNPFWGDDSLQIVNNPLVHSITHLPFFFEGGTFYEGHGLTPLSGAYYRPLMTTVFSLIYTLFGPHPVSYHVLQLLLCIASAVLLYMFFRHFFKPTLSLGLALIFLVHPVNSQVAFAIPSMQDALFFFFGILSLWLLVRFKSVKSLSLVAASLFLCMLSKETAIVFIAMAAIYLFWKDRKRLYPFVGFMIVPVILYLVLKNNAIGLLGTNPHNAPIDNLALTGRLLTAPSIMLFYLSKLIFPWKLATVYYWVHPTFNVRYVLLPLLIDLAVAALVVFSAVMMKTRHSKSQYYTYLFFSAWATLGLLPCLQIIPLDMTACETWFYFSMAGVLGMIGVTLTAYPLRIRPSWILVVLVVSLVGILGFRTAARGRDYQNQYTLAAADVVASPSDYYAYNVMSGRLIEQGEYSQARTYALHSISTYPTYKAYNNLGVADVNTHDFPGAFQAYENVLSYQDGNTASTYENLGELTLVFGDFNSDRQLLLTGLNKYPNDINLWMDLAFLEAIHHDSADAKVAITNAAHSGQVPQDLYEDIVNVQSFTINLTALGERVAIP